MTKQSIRPHPQKAEDQHVQSRDSQVKKTIILSHNYNRNVHNIIAHYNFIISNLLFFSSKAENS